LFFHTHQILHPHKLMFDVRMSDKDKLIGNSNLSYAVIRYHFLYFALY
jgi:hypothetical protein